MSDPFEDQLRSTFRQVAQQTTTSHDLGVPAPALRPSRSRRLVATGALSVLALVGGGAFLATRDSGGPQTVQAAAGDTTSGSETTMPSMAAALANMCANAPDISLPPKLADGQEALQGMLGRVCAGGSLISANPFAACGVDASSLRDLLAPIMSDLGPQLEQLKAILADFEPRIRAITDDPAMKEKLDAAKAALQSRLEGLSDPTSLSDPAVRQKLYDDLEADLAPLTSDPALKAKVESLADDLKARLDAFAASPDGQALKDKFGDGSALKAQAEALAEKLKGCLPK